MRSLSVIALVGLLAGVAFSAPAETLKAQKVMGVGAVEVTLTLSDKAYEWASRDGHLADSVTWGDVQRWACGPNADWGLLLRLHVHHMPGVEEFRFTHDDLVTIVKKYLQKYAADKMDPQEGCNPD
jgi:hypothetical protein